MEFFQFVLTAMYVADYTGLFLMDTETVVEKLQQIYRTYIICAAVGAAVYVILLILGGIALMKMAKRVGMPHRWMGFVPFLNTWYAGKLAGEAHFFGQKMKRAGLYAAIAEGLYSAVSAVSLVSVFLFLPYSDVQQDINPFTNEPVQVIQVVGQRIPQGLRWLYDFGDGFQIIGEVLELILIVLMFVLFIAFFRKYYARGPILMAFLCTILPFRGITLFAVRNNPPVDYDAYMRKRMEEMARQRQQQYGPRGPYGGYGGSYGGGSAQPPKPPEDPFSDFGGSTGGSAGGTAGGSAGGPQGGTPPGDDPFSDF